MLTTARSYRVISICVVVFIGFVAAFAGKLYIASNAAEARGHENLSLELVGESVTAASSADDQPVDEQQDDRADDRADPPRGLLLTSHESRGQESADKRAGDAQQNRDDPAARVVSGHQELRDRADDQTEQQPSNDVHFSSTVGAGDHAPAHPYG